GLVVPEDRLGDLRDRAVAGGARVAAAGRVGEHRDEQEQVAALRRGGLGAHAARIARGAPRRQAGRAAPWGHVALRGASEGIAALDRGARAPRSEAAEASRPQRGSRSPSSARIPPRAARSSRPSGARGGNASSSISDTKSAPRPLPNSYTGEARKLS